MLVSITRSLFCFTGEGTEALSSTAKPPRIGCTSIELNQRENPSEHPAPRFSGQNLRQTDARHGKTTPATDGSRIAAAEPDELVSFSGDMIGVGNGRTSKSQRSAKDRGTQKCPQNINGEENVEQTMVAAGHPGKRRARSQARRLQTDKREENRGVAQAIGGTQFAPQGRRLSLGAVDADLLYQPRRQDIAENTTHATGAREGRVEASVSTATDVVPGEASIAAIPRASAFARRHGGLRRADIRHEAVELFAQPRAFARQGARRIQHLLRGRAGFGGAAIDLHDVGGGFLGALRDVLNAARDFLRRRALLLDRARDRRGDVRDLADGAADLLDRGDRFLRRALHARDVRGNLVGRLRGLAGQRLDLGGDHGKSAAGFAGAGGLDGGVQRQQIGLLGDRRDQLDHVADLLRRARQFADAAVGLLGLTYRRLRDLVGFPHPPADLVDRGGKLFGRGRDRLHVAGGFFRGAGDLAGQALGGFRGPRQRSGRGFELHGRGRNVRDDGAHRGLEIVGKANEFGAARRAARLVLRILGGGIALGLGDRLQLEFLHRARHLAEFVLAAETGQHDIEIAAGEFAHRLAHRRHRAGNALAEQERQHAAEQEAAGREHHDQAFGLADGRIRLRFKPILIGQQVRFHRARALHDRGGGFRPSRWSVRRSLSNSRSAWSATAGIRPAAPETSLMRCTIFSSFDEIACSEFSTNFRRASALVATVLSELTMKVLASAVAA